MKKSDVERSIPVCERNEAVALLDNLKCRDGTSNDMYKHYNDILAQSRSTSASLRESLPTPNVKKL